MSTFKRCFLSVAVLVGILTAGLASASPISITGDTANSTENLGNFTATLNYVASSPTMASFTVQNLTNTSPAANGGFITAFVFNNPNNLITNASLAVTGNPSKNANWSRLGASSFNNLINGQPFGNFDIGATTAQNPNNNSGFEGGGNPNRGIGVTDPAMTFTFTLGGTNLDTLSTSTFLNTLSSPRGNEAGVAAFVVRFRGFRDGGSDKVPAIAQNGNGGDNGDDMAPIPEPASLAIWGFGAMGLAGFGWARRRKVSA